MGADRANELAFELEKHRLLVYRVAGQLWVYFFHYNLYTYFRIRMALIIIRTSQLNFQ